MTISLSTVFRKEAVASIERYCAANVDAPIGNVAAAAQLAFFVEEIGPVRHHRGVADVQERPQARVVEIDIDVHEDAFRFWRRRDRWRTPR